MGNKRGKKINSHNNRLMYTLIAFGILVAIAIGVYAYGTSNPAVFGHSSGEIDVTVDGQTKTLQEAIDAGDLDSGGGGSWPYVIDVKLTSAWHKGGFTDKADWTPTGYPAMYDWIQNNGCSGYHVCTAPELTAAIQSGIWDGKVTFAWYNSGPQKQPTSVSAIDCYGRKSSSGHLHSSVWRYSSGTGARYGYPSSSPCDSEGPVLCCK